MDKYRKPSAQERTILRRSFSKWGVFEHFKDKLLLIRTNSDGKKQIFLSSSEIQVTNGSPIYAGLFIGVLGRQLSPSIEMAQIIAREGIKFPFIKVNSKGESLVVYGRDVFGDSVVEHGLNRENEVVIILNMRNEAIGIGLTRHDSASITATRKVTVTNIVDVGQYIRAERLSG